jgi:hypothetical protein
LPTARLLQLWPWLIVLLAWAGEACATAARRVPPADDRCVGVVTICVTVWALFRPVRKAVLRRNGARVMTDEDLHELEAQLTRAIVAGVSAGGTGGAQAVRGAGSR